MTEILLALGLVLAVEGLVLALAPSRLEQVLALLASLGRDRRRLVGLVSVALGTGLIWLARHLLA